MEKRKKNSNTELKEKLEYHYKKFNKSCMSPDPVEFLHNYKNPLEIELTGFISALFAFGNVKQIEKTLSIIQKRVKNTPLKYIQKSDENKIKRDFVDLKHRYYTGKDIAELMFILKITYRKYGSLENLFSSYKSNTTSMKDAISGFSAELKSMAAYTSNGLSFMFAEPKKGSACKRMNLFLRWMVRDDSIDFGLWKTIKPSELIIPVDTHIAKISQNLGLTTKKTVSWNMAEEITENLRTYCPEDPVKYDFALCHIGMRKLEF